MKPAATFNSERIGPTWRLPDLILSLNETNPSDDTNAIVNAGMTKSNQILETAKRDDRIVEAATRSNLLRMW